MRERIVFRLNVHRNMISELKINKYIYIYLPVGVYYCCVTALQPPPQQHLHPCGERGRQAHIWLAPLAQGVLLAELRCCQTGVRSERAVVLLPPAPAAPTPRHPPLSSSRRRLNPEQTWISTRCSARGRLSCRTSRSSRCVHGASR